MNLASRLASLALGLVAWTAAAGTAAPFGNLPLSFEAGDSTQFVARGRDAQFTISPAGAQLTLRPTATGSARSVQMQFVGAAAQAGIHGDGELSGKINYLVGNNPVQWRSGVPTFARVRVSGIYPGINLVYYGNQQQVEYDFNLAAGVSPDAIAIRFSGADKVSVDGQGALVLTLGRAEIRQPKPVIYQTVGSLRKEITGGYQLLDDHTVAFAVGPHDPALPLVIDPVLTYSTYFGGLSGDLAWAVAVDTNGFVYVAGQTFSAQKSSGVPFSTPGAYQTNFAGGSLTGDAFVAKFGNSGTNLIYLTYLGGSADDAVTGVAVDAAGNAFVTGFTDSANFPTSTNAPYPKIGGVYSSSFGSYPADAFVAELNSSGSNLVYSTYLGGSGKDIGWGIAVDLMGDAYVTGYSYSSNFPTVNALQSHQACVNSVYYNANAFVTEIAPGGGSLVFSTYLGGTNFDVGRGIAVDASGIYVTGYTASTNFPTTNYIVQTIGTNSYNGSLLNESMNLNLSDDAFVTKYAPGGTSLIYSTLLGSTNTDIGAQIAVDAVGNAYVAGYTTSPNFPNTLTNVPGLSSFLVTNNQSLLVTNAFLTQITWNGTNAGIGYSAVFGGQGNDAANALAVDPAGNAFVVGSATSANFPTINTNGYLSGVNAGGSDAFITAFSPNGAVLLYSAYLGGNGNDEAYGVALDSSDNAYIVGQTTSTTFPTVNPVQATVSGPSDTFIAEVISFPTPPVITTQPTNQDVVVGATVNFNVSVTGTAPFSYQWQLNGTNLHNGTYISGVTNNALTINNAQTTNSGSYTVVVVNNGGTVTSSNAVLTVTNMATVLTQQPASQTVAIGSTVTFSINGSVQSPYSVQWLKDGTNLMNDGQISGATNNNGVLTISNVQTNNNGTYWVVVSNAWGVLTSSNAVLTVVSFPTITVPPTNQMVGLGSVVTFAVTAVGTGTLSYQWQFNGVNLTDDGTNISGSTTATLTLNNAQTGYDGGYSVIVTNSIGSVTSAPPAVLTVLTAPKFTGITAVNDGSGSFIFNGVGGTNSGNYTVLASTNLATPLNQWRPVSVIGGQFGSQGQFVFTNTPPPGIPQRFYIVILPAP
jgi:hypothetical protein